MLESILVNEWKTEWLAEGEAKGKRAALIRLLELKFESPVPADLAEAVGAETDPDVLSDWFDRAVLAPSLDALRRALGR